MKVLSYGQKTQQFENIHKNFGEFVVKLETIHSPIYKTVSAGGGNYKGICEVGKNTKFANFYEHFVTGIIPSPGDFFCFDLCKYLLEMLKVKLRFKPVGSGYLINYCNLNSFVIMG